MVGVFDCSAEMCVGPTCSTSVGPFSHLVLDCALDNAANYRSSRWVSLVGGIVFALQESKY